MQGSTGGVLGLLEVVESDFARLESETAAEEDEAAREYAQFMVDSKKDKAVKEVDLKHATHNKEDTLRELTETKTDLEGVQEQLTAAMNYYDKLKPSCVDAGYTYE